MKQIYFLLTLMVLVSVSCKKKGYILGGSLESTQTYAHTLTYDVLKGNPSFDTLAMLLDTAGLIDAVNQPNTTLFAPTDISIYGYLQARTIADQNVDPSAQFGLDSLIYYIRNNINGTRDSLSMYIIAQPLPFSALTAAGIVYPTGLSGDSAIVSYEYTKDGNLGYNSIVSSVPQVVYFTQLWQHYAIGPNTPADSITTQGAHTLCTTSGIQTQNGYLNTLESSSVLFFYGSKP